MRMSWLMRENRFMIYCDCSDEDVMTDEKNQVCDILWLQWRGCHSWLMRRNRFMMHCDCSDEDVLTDEKKQVYDALWLQWWGCRDWWEKPGLWYIVTAVMRMSWLMRRNGFMIYCDCSDEDVMTDEKNQVYDALWLQWWRCHDWRGKPGLWCIMVAAMMRMMANEKNPGS